MNPKSRYKKFDKDEKIESILCALIDVSEENISITYNSIKLHMNKIFQNEDDYSFISALEISRGFNFPLSIQANMENVGRQEEIYKFSKEIIDCVFDSYVERVLLLSEKSKVVWNLAYGRGKLGIEFFVRHFGFQEIVQSIGFDLFPQCRSFSPILQLFSRILNLKVDDPQMNFLMISDLEFLCEILEEKQFPVFTNVDRIAKFNFDHYYSILSEERDWTMWDSLQLSEEALFGCFILFAILFEIKNPPPKFKEYLLNEIIRPKSEIIFLTFLSKEKNAIETGLLERLESSKFSVRQKKFIFDWTNSKITLIENNPINQNQGEISRFIKRILGKKFILEV